MSTILSNTLTFRSFNVTRTLEPGFRDALTASVEKLVIQPNPQSSSEIPVMGWVNFTDPGDTNLYLSKILFDRYIALGVRIDKKAVNGKLLKIHLDRRIREVMHERGLERIGKKYKAEIKEAVTEELLRQALPSIGLYDLIWDIEGKRVLVFASSDTTIDSIQYLFKDTFGMGLYQDRMVDWLVESMTWEEINTRTDEYIPGGTADKLVGLDPDGWHEGNPLRAREFTLGTEFLSWLWYETTERSGDFKINREPITSPGAVTQREIFAEDEVDYDHRQQAIKREPDSYVTVWMDNKMVFRCAEDDAPAMMTMVGSAPSDSEEARISMLSGKRPVEARIGMRYGEEEWFCTLQAGQSGLRINGVKFQTIIKEGTEEMLYERMLILQNLTSALKGMFQQFFKVRTSPRWEGLIESWIMKES